MTKAERTFFIENLGCPKNAVEGEGMAERLRRAGYAAVAAADQADVVVVNTCSFIRPAQEESIARIFHYLGRRRAGQRVVAAGCLAERYGAALASDIPELDGILGTRRWFEIDRLLDQVERGVRPCWHGAEPLADPSFGRTAAGPTAYVKIAEGCNMSCTFCAIPGFKGAQRSKRPADVVAEIRQLVDGGVREVILVSQNTTAYGLDAARDPAGRDARGAQGSHLARLLETICESVPELPWLRFHYCYPGWVNDELLRTMAALPQVVKYLDMPLQHAHSEILGAMNRPRNVEHVRRVLERARELLPGVALRTTFIVGFPGETPAHFRAVLELMGDVRFDHVGIFPYYADEGTPSESLPGQVSDRVKQRRKRQALELQQGISLERNQGLVGTTIQVLVEGEADQSLAAPAAAGRTLIGRTYRDAPEVDGFVLLRGTARRGDLVDVRVTAAGPYDLFGQQIGLESADDGVMLSGPGEMVQRRSAARIGLKPLSVLQPR